ncbi:hypothetical protein LWI29_031084 [Acer saccharum]|uniref:Uncharacterized protein n=1 Tax=Acer saccharum TaxID=4024 RepID=A0AA39TAC0_ACESA|nr:hypothetical protein LWI29_031084 [Acer saccharum]
MGLIPCLVSWRLWRRRCAANLEGKLESISDVWLSIKHWVQILSNSLTEVRHWNYSDDRVLRNMEVQILLKKQKKIQVLRWLKPAPGRLKLNLDGSSLGNSSPAGGGGVLRDSSEGTSEETKKEGHGLGPGPTGNCSLNSDVGSDLLMVGPDLDKGPGDEKGQIVHCPTEERLVLTKLSYRNWKQLARAQSAVLPLRNQSSKFWNLQTVSTKGKQSSQGNGSSSITNPSPSNTSRASTCISSSFSQTQRAVLDKEFTEEDVRYF